MHPVSAFEAPMVELHRNTIGPIGGWNGLWIYGTSDVIAENNTIQETSKEPVLIGEYHYQDQGWQVPAPSAARLYLANNNIMNNTGTCNSQMYGGDFLPCRSRVPLLRHDSQQRHFGYQRRHHSRERVPHQRPRKHCGLTGWICRKRQRSRHQLRRQVRFNRLLLREHLDGVSQVYNVTESRRPFNPSKSRPPATANFTR